MGDLLGVCRLSRDADESTSIERQVEQLELTARVRGDRLVHVCVDTDVSGGVSPFERPELGPWLTDPDRIGRYSGLITPKLDRLTRSLIGFAELVGWCEARGKTLISVAESLDLTTAAGLCADTLVRFSQYERERMSERRAEAAAKLRSVARWGGGNTPYGYRPEPLDGGGGFILVPDPGAVAVVERIAAQVVAGRSLNSLARELTRQGVPTPQGKATWSVPALTHVLRNPALRGYVTTSVRGGKPQVVRSPDGMPVRLREAILDDTAWATLQAALDRNVQRKSGRRRDAALLLRVLFCGECATGDGDAPMYATRSVRRGKPYAYYVCRNRTRVECRAPGVPMAAVEGVVGDILTGAIGDVAMRRRVVHPADDTASEIARAEESLAELEVEYVAGRLSAAAFARMTTRLEERLAGLRRAPGRPERVEWVPTGQTFTGHWNGLDDRGRHALLLEAGVRATVHRDDPDPVAELMGYPLRRASGRYGEPAVRQTETRVVGGLRVTVELGDLLALREMAASRD